MAPGPADAVIEVSATIRAVSTGDTPLRVQLMAESGARPESGATSRFRAAPLTPGAKMADDHTVAVPVGPGSVHEPHGRRARRIDGKRNRAAARGGKKGSPDKGGSEPLAGTTECQALPSSDTGEGCGAEPEGAHVVPNA